jgi:hypothetical protein
MRESVFAHVFRLEPETASDELDRKFPEQLERWTHEVGVRPADLARAIGRKREKLYAIFRGAAPLRAQELYLLPPALLLVVLRDIASTLHHDVRPAAVDALPVDYDHGRDCARYVRELTDCLRQRAESEADGALDVAEIDAELRELDEASAAIETRRAFLERARAERGGLVRSIVDRLRGGR